MGKTSRRRDVVSTARAVTTGVGSSQRHYVRTCPVATLPSSPPALPEEPVDDEVYDGVEPFSIRTAVWLAVSMSLLGLIFVQRFICTCPNHAHNCLLATCCMLLCVQFARTEPAFVTRLACCLYTVAVPINRAYAIGLSAWAGCLVACPLINVVRIWRRKYAVREVSDIWRNGPAKQWVPFILLLMVLPMSIMMLTFWDYRGQHSSDFLSILYHLFETDPVRVPRTRTHNRQCWR